MLPEPVVFIIDDDPDVRDSVLLSLSTAGLKARAFKTAEEFLAHEAFRVCGPACLIVDVRLPGLSGLGLQNQLTALGMRLPTIVLTGYGTIPLAVEAVKGGALDFLQKPVSQAQLLRCVHQALDLHAEQLAAMAHRPDCLQLLHKLTRREREVMEGLCNGKAVKEIAAELGVSPQTAAKHRATLFAKLQIDSIAELVRFNLELEGAIPAR